MAYTKTVWVNGETALSDVNMNHIESGIKDAHDAIAETDETVAELKTAGSELLLAIYPVGSILFNANGVNPATYIGGTWEAWGSGRVPVGVNTDDTDFNTAEKAGGRKDAVVPYHNHSFTGTALGNHTHPSVVTNVTTGTQGVINGKAPYAGTQTVCVTSVTKTTGNSGAASAGTPSGTISYKGNATTDANANLQPYITCYMWKRTA